MRILGTYICRESLRAQNPYVPKMAKVTVPKNGEAAGEKKDIAT